jgi:hypothetical protein
MVAPSPASGESSPEPLGQPASAPPAPAGSAPPAPSGSARQPASPLPTPLASVLSDLERIETTALADQPDLFQHMHTAVVGALDTTAERSSPRDA